MKLRPFVRRFHWWFPAAALTALAWWWAFNYLVDFRRQGLTAATVITLDLQPHVNAELRPQLDRLRPGTRVVSHMFSMPGARPAKKITVKSAETGLEHPVYLWVTPIEWE